MSEKWWSESPLRQLILSGEDNKNVILYNFLFFFNEERSQNVIHSITFKTFYFRSVPSDQTLQGILWILETYLGTQLPASNLDLFQPANFSLVPL